MNGLLRAAAIVTLAISFPAATAKAQSASTDSLLRRIEVLESATVDLQLRVRELEALVKSEPSQDRAVQVSATKWRDLANWRQLRRGMSMDQVRALLGEPERVDAYGEAFTIWSWDSGSANVRFDGSSDKLSAWSEPRR